MDEGHFKIDIDIFYIVRSIWSTASPSVEERESTNSTYAFVDSANSCFIFDFTSYEIATSLGNFSS